MSIKLTSAAILTSIALLGAGSVESAGAQGIWTNNLPVNPATAWLTNGVVVKASNLGPASGSTINIQPVIVSGITFDTVLTNVSVDNDGSSWGSGYIPGGPADTLYYSGTDSSLSNLVNAWAWAHSWWNDDPDQNVYLNFSNLVPGHNYQLQLLIGFPWDYDGVNLYGPNGEYMWFASQAGQGTNVGMATFTWTATSTNARFDINMALSQEVEVSAYSLIDTSATFIFDTFGDGFWTIINQGNGNTLVVNSSGASQAVVTNTAFQQQFELLYNEEDGTFRLRNHDSWLCIGALNGATTNGTPVVTVANYTGAASQKWNFVSVGGNYYRIVNVASGLALQTDNGSPANVTLATLSTSTYQYWSFAYQTHYPKKGMAGLDSQPLFNNASWLYNWGNTTTASLTPSQVYEPMQWGPWWPDINSLQNYYAAWHTEKPTYILGFNEPDNSTQSDMTTATAIALWPQLQAMNLPLVSPACANDFGGWLSDFYNKIATNGYRVDYTGYHWYSNPNASGLINTLNNAYATWGRPIWLTEFSVVDWSGTATWTEQDDYRFLAEFMWQAESSSNEWLKRYSLFLFSGTPSVNPWDGTGATGDAFLNDNYTLTPFGELYAGWDADITLRTKTPYFIHNCATCFRLTSARNVTGPAALSIRHEDATTQWMLANALTGDYIQSLADGRRLRYSGGVLDLAPPGTTGEVVQWKFSGPDSNGYYFITNSAGVNLSASGSGGSISIGTSASISDNTRWRLVKPYYPVSLALVLAPTNLTASAANLSVTLRWSGGARRYNVYRATSSGGPYTQTVSDLKWSFYTDNTAANGTTYYYAVTALDNLENESGYSNQAAAAPASGAGLGLVTEYQFENTAQDGSGNGFDGLLNGVTSYVAGRVGSHAINFTGGDDSYMEIPNPVGNDFSIVFWVNTTATGGTGQWWSGEGLVDGEVSGATNDFGVSLVGSNVGFGIGNPDTTITSTTAVNDGNWHHVAATRSGVTGAMQLYVDSVLQATGAGATATRSTPVSLHIGNLQSGYNHFAGSIDEVRIYNYVISPATVTQLAATPQFFPPAFPAAGISLLPGGGISLAVTGAVGAPYRLWGGTNVALTPVSNTWTLLNSGTITVSPFTLTDMTATNFAERFYRFSTP